MKKIALGIFAFVINFSAIAQQDGNRMNEKNHKHKEHRNRGFNGKENLDKLNLTNAQKAEMKTINERFRQQMQDLNKQGNITVDEKKQRRTTLIRERKEKIASILNAEQRRQVETTKEFRGDRKDGRSFERFDGLSKDLDFTSEQTAKMSALNSTFKSKLQNLKQNSALSKDEKREQIRSLMKHHRSDIEALLTNDQREQMKSNRKNRPNRTAVK